MEKEFTVKILTRIWVITEKVILKDVSNMRIIEKRTIVKTIITSNEDL